MNERIHFKVIIIVTILLSLLYINLNGEYFFIPKKELEKRGVPFSESTLVNISYKGDYIVLSHFIKDIKKRMKGYVWALKIIRIKNKKVYKVDSIELPIVNWVNGVVSDKKDEMYVVGNHGTKILKINLKTLNVKVVWKHKKGKSGFKTGYFLICYKGKFYAVGYFYDREQYSLGDYLVQYVYKKKKKRIIFRKKINLSKLFNPKRGFVKSFFYISGDKLLYSLVKRKQKLTYLYYYKRGKNILIDKGYMLLVFVGAKDRIFYNVFYKKKSKIKHIVKDLRKNKTLKVGKDGSLLISPMISKNGKRLVLFSLNRKTKRMIVYYYLLEGKNKYKLVKFIDNYDIGPLRMTPNGKKYVIMVRKGLRVGTFD